MVLWVWLDDGTLRSLSAILHLASLALGAAIVVQFLYGGLIYVLLTRIGLWRLWIVALAYLVPLLVLGWFTIDTPREGWGMIGWVVLVCMSRTCPGSSLPFGAWPSRYPRKSRAHLPGVPDGTTLE